MAKRFITLMAALLVLGLGLVVTGCGDDESSNDSGDTAAQTVTDTDTVTEDETVTDTETVTDETDTDVTSDDNGGAVVPKEAVDRCKQGVDNASHLSEDSKDSIKDICEKAGSGDVQKAREAAVEVCKKQAANIPEGVPGRDRAMAACEQAGK
jgi:hypothetical protein